MASSARSPIVLAVVSGALALGGYWWLRSRDPEPEPKPQPPAVPQVQAPQAPPTPEAAVAPGPKPAEPKAVGKMVFPDGSEQPALNRVTERMVLSWPKQFPYTPIVGRETDKFGREWYVHGDGSRSTTYMQYRDDLRREAPAAVIMNPTQAADVLHEEPGKEPRLIPGGKAPEAGERKG